MIVKQFVNEGLGNSSYLVASTVDRVALVVDPQRDVDVYVNAAAELGVTITHALETHLHADFVSGSRELAAKTGCHIGASAGAKLEFHHLSLKEADRIKSGRMVVTVLDTPGHSPDHICYLLTEEGSRRPAALFSGGALVVGGAARTDLLGHEHTHSLTHQLYHTIREKLILLPDNTRVYPTHGAGSYCLAATGARAERVTTIRREKKHNRLIAIASEEDFIKTALEGLPRYPAYFTFMPGLNRKGPPLLGDLPVPPALKPAKVKQLVDQGYLAMDTRPFHEFARGHIPGAINNPLRHAFVSFLGWVAPFGSPLIIVPAETKDIEEIVRQAIRIGYDNLAGYPEGGMKAWMDAGFPVDSFDLTTPEEVYQEIQTGKTRLLDVRMESEWKAGHAPGATHIELGELQRRITEVPSGSALAVTCSLGNRSSTAVSILRKAGFKRVKNVAGGMTRWKEARLPLVRG